MILQNSPCFLSVVVGGASSILINKVKALAFKKDKLGLFYLSVKEKKLSFVI